MSHTQSEIENARELSPLRKTTTATTVKELVEEQLAHFSIDPNSAYGVKLGTLTEHIYSANAAAHDLWSVTVASLASSIVVTASPTSIQSVFYAFSSPRSWTQFSIHSEKATNR